MGQRGTSPLDPPTGTWVFFFMVRLVLSFWEKAPDGECHFHYIIPKVYIPNGHDLTTVDVN